MGSEVFIYRAVGLAFLICLPVALAAIVLPARSLLRKRLRWGALAFVGFGCLLVGFVASWPAPKTITAVLMLGGLLAFATGSLRGRGPMTWRGTGGISCQQTIQPSRALESSPFTGTTSESLWSGGT